MYYNENKEYISEERQLCKESILQPDNMFLSKCKTQN